MAIAAPPIPLVGCNDRADVAAFLGTTKRYLTWLLYVRKIREDYHEFEIGKSGGRTRRIKSPPVLIRRYQRKIATALLELYVRKPAVHGFVREKSIATNARSHLRKRIVVNLDLKNFFPSITIQRFIAVLKQPPFSLGYEAAVAVAQLTFDSAGFLPQGAASSPIISNIIARRLDTKLQNLAKGAGCTYTRYADDITFSSTRPRLDRSILTTRLEHFVPSDAIRNAIKEEGFRVNYRKFKVSEPGERQFVTGLTVNEITNVRRNYVRELNSLFHIWRKYGELAAEEAYRRRHRRFGGKPGILRRVIRGKLSFLGMVRGDFDPVYRRLARDLYEIDDSFPAPPILSPVLASPLIGRINAKPDWTQVVQTCSRAVRFVEVQSPTSDPMSATGFVYAHNIALTAGHVIREGCTVMIYVDDETKIAPTRAITFDRKGELDFAILKFPDRTFSKPCIETECRIPCVGEGVMAIGYPKIAWRLPTIVSHLGVVEALPQNWSASAFFLQTSFQSGGGLSGSPLLDQRGRALGIMIENVYLHAEQDKLDKPYGQAMPIGYVDEAIRMIRLGKESEVIAKGARVVVW